MKPKKLAHVLINPPKAVKIITIVFTLLLIIASMVLLVIDLQNTIYRIISYAVFALTGCFLAYSVLLIVLNWKNLRGSVANFIENNDVAYVLIKDLGYRSVFIACFSLFIGIAYAIFNGVMAILSVSIWYLSLSIYYLALVIMRGAILLYQKKKLKKQNDELSSIKTYRNSGIALLITHTAITVAVLQMIFINKFFVYPGLLIYVASTYAFSKITLSVINIVKSRKQRDYTIKALLSINFADAVISILALQTAMLNTFGQTNQFTVLANALTGSVTCLITLGLGIYMIIKGQRKLDRS